MSFQQGVSGLAASARNLEVIGNSVANASTVGAKGARAEFADVYARAINGGASSIGQGVTLSAVTQQFSQGSFRTSEGPLDMAINGDGFFQLKDTNGASQYSRVHAKSGEFLLSRSLASLECELDPARFFRIHRSAIVNAAHVREVMSRGDGRYNVYLHGGEALPLGRGRRDTLHRLLGGMKKGGDSPLFPRAGKGDSPQKSGGPKAAAST